MSDSNENLTDISDGCVSQQQISMLMEQPEFLKQIVENAKTDSWELWSKALLDLTHTCRSRTVAHAESMVNASGLEPLITVLALENTKQTLSLAVLDALRKTSEAGQVSVNHKKLQQFFCKKTECIV